MPLDHCGAPADALEQMMAVARRHGEDGDSDEGCTHEVGDLQQLASAMWGFLTQEQRKAVWYSFKGGFDDEDWELFGGRP